MSLIVSTPEQIHNHPVNNSVSKNRWSIPKAKRFQGLTPSAVTDSIYELPSTRTSRTTTLGHGSKYDFTAQARDGPAPNQYQTIQNLSRDLSKCGVTMAPGRDVHSG